jgi:hypothetical protein
MSRAPLDINHDFKIQHHYISERNHNVYSEAFAWSWGFWVYLSLRELGQQNYTPVQHVTDTSSIIYFINLYRIQASIRKFIYHFSDHFFLLYSSFIKKKKKKEVEICPSHLWKPIHEKNAKVAVMGPSN